MSRKAKGYSGLHYLYVKYKNRAQRKGLVFRISEKKFKEITSQRCYYCSTKPYTVSVVNNITYSTEGKQHSAYVFNGIDRIDNSKGYYSRNVVPCCGICNRMKSAMTMYQFLTHVAIINTNSRIK